MKERPILFSGAMVRALLAGTKTQTRRTIKPAPPASVTSVYLPFTGEPNNWQGYNGNQDCIARYGSCPYGAPGDRLWVRETWMDLQGTGVEVRTGDRSRYAYGADPATCNRLGACRRSWRLVQLVRPARDQVGT